MLLAMLPCDTSSLPAFVRVLSVGITFALLAPIRAQAAEAIEFGTHIAPLLSSHCIECHNPADRKGQLDLTQASGLAAGGESGPITNPEHPDQSLLWKRLIAGEMPPEDRGRSRKLPTDELARIQAWLQAGAPWPETERLDRFDQTTDSRAGRDWWAFQPIQRPLPPGPSHLHPIDAFVQQTLEQAKLPPAAQASKRHLIRRAYYDLIGLPPTHEQVAAFLADNHPNAYERVLETLLSSPHYGERWGRYWLDVVRFAETDGYERDRLKPQAWRYRDWVIDAFNSDKPYDRFVIEQLAGDEIPNRTEQSVIGTGMLRVGTWNDEPNDPADYLYERLEDMVHTTSSTFLGLTIKCARCHDHKFDPIRQADYYRVASYFWPGPIGQANQGGPSAEQLGFPDVYGWTDLGSQTKPIHLLINGERHKPAQEIAPGFPSTLASMHRPFNPPPEGAATTQRRLQFAQWITDTENPLTPRVLVNRLWQHHFGRGIVSTPNNFGFKSAPPSHPQLLDWLAAELVTPSVGAGAPWTLKRMHRLIMTSQTYRQASLPTDATRQAEQDPNNILLGHFPRRRMDAEALRDSILMASGKLDHRLGGPSFFPRMSSEALEGLSRKQAAWQESPEPERARRSVYMMTQRSRLLPLMTAFDFTETTSTCAQRDVTTVAPQSLALMNNGFVVEAAESMAKRIENTADPVRSAWQIAFQRDPTQSERQQATEFLARQTAEFEQRKLPDTDAQALASLCHVLFNTNEFIYVD